MKKSISLFLAVLLALSLALPALKAEAATAKYHINYLSSESHDSLAGEITGSVAQGSSFMVEAPDFESYTFSHMTVYGENTAGAQFNGGETTSSPAKVSTKSDVKEIWVTVYYDPAVVTYTIRYHYFPDPNSFKDIRGISKGTLSVGKAQSFTAPEIDGYEYSDISYFRILPSGAYTSVENVWDSDTVTITAQAGDGHFEIAFNYVDPRPVQPTEPEPTKSTETEPAPTESSAEPTKSTETEPAPTESSAEPTKTTESSAEPTKTTESSAVPTQPTESSAVPTQPAESSAEPTKPTESSAAPTKPGESTAAPTQSGESSVEPTEETKPHEGDKPGSALLKGIALGGGGVALIGGSMLAGIKAGKASRKKGKKR